jgi:hypothetical protein
MNVTATIPTREMNKTEIAFARVLESMKITGQILWYAYEPIKIRLADKTYYTVDFLVVEATGRLVAYEVKAYWKSAGRAGWTDDSRVKIKVAAEHFPIKFYAAIQHKDHWDYEEF